MRRITQATCLLALVGWPLRVSLASADSFVLEEITKGLKVMHGAVNGAFLGRGGKTFAVRVYLPEGWTLHSMRPDPIGICAREGGTVEMKTAVPNSAAAGTRIVTADLCWGDWDLREWTEALVTLANSKQPRVWKGWHLP